MKTTLATVSLSGELGAKLEAIAEVGFDGCTLAPERLSRSRFQSLALLLLTA